MTKQDNIKIALLLGHIAALKDHDTSEHNTRVAYLSCLFGEKLNLNRPTLQALMKGAFLHDIDKIGIPDAILLKNGKLNKSEWEIMKSHTTLGAELVQDIKWFDDARDVILHHHEKFDGTGYPDGLKGDEIPLHVRAFSVIDVFDALIAHRPYKKEFSLEKAKQIIQKDSNSHFDPNLIKEFLPLCNSFYNISKNYTHDELKEKLVKKREKIFG
jgi:putative nucleotidyltransferase with HDIG domain